MKKLTILVAVALLGVTVAIPLALAGPGGPISNEAFAHIITPTGTPGPPMFHVEVDADARNGNRPCDPMDETADVVGTAEAAVCITNAHAHVGWFTFKLGYDVFNYCQDISCSPSGPCVDGNPDLNDGSALGSGVPTNPDLGDDWNCDAPGGLPACGNWEASMECLGLGSYTSPIDAGPWPLAVVILGSGLSVHLELADVELYDDEDSRMGRCNFDSDPGDIPCFGATINAVTPTATPTATPTTAPVGGFAELPAIDHGAGGSPLHSWLAGMLGLVAAAGGMVLLAAGAWYVRRQRRAG